MIQTILRDINLVFERVVFRQIAIVTHTETDLELLIFTIYSKSLHHRARIVFAETSAIINEWLGHLRHTFLNTIFLITEISWR